MTSWQIDGGGYSATVLGAGGGLGTLTHEGVPLLAGPLGSPVTAGRGQVLVPWPNRLRDGAYTFAGTPRQLALSEPSRHNASHGLVRWCTWQQVAGAPDAVTVGCRLAAQSGYPWTLEVTVGYAVSAGGLTVTLTATNASDAPAPFAAGMHPYLDVGAPLDRAVLTLPVSVHQVVDPDRLLPTGTEPADPAWPTGRRLDGVTLDDAFTGLARDHEGRALVRLEAERAVELWLDTAWPWLQAFTGDEIPDRPRQALAVEPMSAPADAFNSGTDLVVLEPGATWSGRFGIRTG